MENVRWLCITCTILYKNVSIFEFGYPQGLWGSSEDHEMSISISHFIPDQMSSLLSHICNFPLQYGETKPGFHYPQYILHSAFLYVTNFPSTHTDRSLDPGPAGHPSAVVESLLWPHHICSKPAEFSAWLCQIHWPNT